MGEHDPNPREVLAFEIERITGNLWTLVDTNAAAMGQPDTPDDDDLGSLVEVMRRLDVVGENGRHLRAA